MSKKCPQCGSENVTLYTHSLSGSWKCKECGYIGPLIVEEDDEKEDNT